MLRINRIPFTLIVVGLCTSTFGASFLQRVADFFRSAFRDPLDHLAEGFSLVVVGFCPGSREAYRVGRLKRLQY